MKTVQNYSNVYLSVSLQIRILLIFFVPLPVAMGTPSLCQVIDGLGKP